MLFSQLTAFAEDGAMIYDTSKIYESLSDEVKQSLENIGVSSADANELNKLSFESIISEIINLASQNISSPLKGLITITALLLVCSMLSAYKNTISADTSSALNLVSTLCITCAAAIPAIDIINTASGVISSSSDIMLVYIPVMLVIMSSSGHAVSGASYYTLMLSAAEGIGQLSSKAVVPLLDMFLGLSITGSISSDINLNGFTTLISKIIKWLLAFAMTIFTSLLTIKQLITASLDSVSSKAVRFAFSSFIPIVGSALSDAYKTVQGSIGVLKSGVGIFVIISLAFVFLPIILQILMWITTLWIGKATAEVLNLPQPQRLMESIATVFQTLLAVILSVTSVYIISTALILLIGGGAS